MIKDPVIFLKHILESIKNIEEFSKNLTKAKFMKDLLRQSAIMRQIEVIGEAVKNLPPDFTSKHPNVSWKEIAGARDKITHHYFGVDLDIIWEIVEKDIKKLKENISSILDDYESKQGKSKK